MNEKRQMTLSLTDSEMDDLDNLSKRRHLSKTAIIRMSLRLFRLLDERAAQGGKLFIEAEDKQKTELALL